jgi:hypothetical protein
MSESAAFHHCEAPRDTVWGMYGSAISECTEHADGSLWVDNGEYGNTVRFCPFCGFEGKWLGQDADDRYV